MTLNFDPMTKYIYTDGDNSTEFALGCYFGASVNARKQHVVPDNQIHFNESIMFSW